ncbi:MAG: DUF819 family protein, partial [bacterium]|nr:DUF819 family protein [bacterium]
KLIIKESGPTLIAFLIGGVGTVVGTVVAFYLIPLGEEGWKLAGIFCSTYIGGSINYVASAEALQMKTGELLAAGIAADNLVMTLYFLLLFALPSIKFLRKQFVSRHEHAPQATASAGEAAQKQAPQMDLLSMALTLALSAVLCAAGYGLAALIGIKSTGILFVTALSVIVATLFPKKASSLGGDQMGMLLMQIFFVVIGATANIIIVFKVGPILFVFAALILLIHLFFILVGGKLFKLDLVEIVLASNANMGGPTTAAAMAVARKWDSLVIPAILCGTLGYAIATFIGVAVGNLLK